MSLPAWMDNKQRLRKQNARSRKQENDYFKQRGGKPRAGSGSSYKQPQDGKVGEELVQLKYTDKNSYTLNRIEWLKLRNDAAIEGAVPVMIIDIKDIRLRVTEEDA